MTAPRARALLDSMQLRAAAGKVLDEGRMVVLLVLRLPEFSEAAWHKGKRAGRVLERATSSAFARTARAVVREGDLLVHDPGRDWFGVAMLAPARGTPEFDTLDARAALDRMAAGIVVATGRRVETGWWPLVSRRDLEDTDSLVARALERGARERERLEFLATVGHELRTPLSSIRGYLETVLDEGPDVATTRRFLQTARAEALRLSRLIDGMLDFSMLDLSPQTALRRSSDVALTLHAARDSLAPLAARRRIAVSLAVPDAIFARIDSDACMHAVVNLIENALKYGRPGGEVRVEARRSQPFVDVTVDDDGPGIAADERTMIFELHGRGRTALRRKGLGIGLTIVRTIAEHAGGSVHIEPSPLGGARFRLRIPLAGNAAWAESAAFSS